MNENGLRKKSVGDGRPRSLGRLGQYTYAVQFQVKKKKIRAKSNDHFEIYYSSPFFTVAKKNVFISLHQKRCIYYFSAKINTRVLREEKF